MKASITQTGNHITGPKGRGVMFDNYHILACETLKPELAFVMKARSCPYPAAWIPSGKHLWPDKLHVCIQEELDKIPASFDTILLAFGFCGNAMVGVKAGARRLVLPRLSDCISLFLGSEAKRKEYGPNIYFFTEGYLHSETSFTADIARYTRKYGRERAGRLMKAMLEHYKELAVIDTGVSDTARIRGELEEFARIVKLPVSTIPGKLRLFDALLAGNWKRDDFIIIEPGGEFTLDDSLSVNARQ
jgi:hypothetical protein